MGMANYAPPASFCIRGQSSRWYFLRGPEIEIWSDGILWGTLMERGCKIAAQPSQLKCIV